MKITLTQTEVFNICKNHLENIHNLESHQLDLIIEPSDSQVTSEEIVPLSEQLDKKIQLIKFLRQAIIDLSRERLLRLQNNQIGIVDGGMGIRNHPDDYYDVSLVGAKIYVEKYFGW